jgi:putative endonuclease
MGWLGQMGWSLVERAQAGLDWLARKRGRAPIEAAHLETGLQGEDAAYFHLSRKGYRVVARRWSSGNVAGDLDLVAWQGSILCFAEVKTRTAHDATAAEAAVDWHKRKILRGLAHHYMRQFSQPIPPPVRFDVISVYMVPGETVEILHFENAFSWSEYRPQWE